MKKSGLRKGRSSESLEKSPKEEGGRRRRQKSLSLTREQRVSREPSISSIGREVRCACQYYQTDSLLPERKSLFGSRPSSKDSDMSDIVGEHVYEPINPPPLTAERKEEQHREEVTEKMASKGSSIPETDKQFTRIPSKRDLAKQESMETKTSEEMEVEGVTYVQDIQDQLENRFLAPSPSATSATTASQSKTDVTSSVLDSSGFEDFPIKQRSLVRNRREQMRAQAQDIQQKLRNHAGRIRNKFNSMPKPSLGRKDRVSKEKSGEKSRFRLPEMHTPKISLPDTSKFKFPEKGKFHLPETSKLHLPDRSKFRLPEKGKFHLPERPKLSLADRARIRLPERGRFHLPDKSKFHLPDKSKFHLPDKSKFHLPDRSKFHLPEASKFHLPEKAKFHLPDTSKFHLPSLPNRPKLELPSFGRSPRETQSSPRSLKSRFDFDLKSYPKLFTKSSKEYITSSPKQTRGRTPPPRMKQPETPAQSSKKWREKIDDMKFADEDAEEAVAKETDSRKSESLFEREGYMEDLDKMPQGGRTISTKSSASRLSDKDLLSSESSDDRKKGVLEEINPDEFFLRQKGISQDDIDMGKYLSREIREAFRSPDINALAKMDYIDADDENVDPMKYQTEPKRPKRTGSAKKKSILKKTPTSNPSLVEDGYKTYPPRRPGRKSRSQSKSLLNEEAVIAEPATSYENADVNMSRYEETDTNLSRYEDDDGNLRKYEDEDVNLRKYETADVNLSRYENVDYDEDNLSEYYKTPGPAMEYQHYKVPRPHAPSLPSPSVKRKSSIEDETSHKRIHEDWDDEQELQLSEPPKPMARRKHKKKVAELESTGEEVIPQEASKEPEEVVPEIIESPVPPKRTRTRSSGSRSLRSFVTESDVNRSFHSEPPIERLEEFEDEIVPHQIEQIEESPIVGSVPEFLNQKVHDYEVTDLDDAGFGYATVGKPTVVKPERHKKQKPDRPPPPRRKKEISVPIYNTYPRRAPVRPLRNYSTLGPSRPPRHRKIPPIEKTLSERQMRTYSEIKSRQITEPLDFIEVSGSSKELQTEKVFEKMKGRPLPPPPRPPRQKSKGPEDEFEPTEDEKLSLSILRDDEFPIERKVTAFVHEPPVEREMVEEICASTQTDPLPEDFSFETEGSSDVMQEFSHEQLRIQQAFLEEMKKEEEEIRERGRTNESDMVDAELKAEVIRQIEDIIAEEKRILERKNDERIRREESAREAEPKKSHLDVDADMGYASLERRGHRQEPQVPPPPEASQALTPKMEKLQVKELEVETLSVHEVQSDQIFVKELQGNRIASQEIDNTGGTTVLGNIDLPPSLIEQIVAKIPWEKLRETLPGNASEGTGTSLPSPPVRPQRRQHRGAAPLDDSDDESLFQPRKSQRRRHRPQYSSDEEDGVVERKMVEERKQLQQLQQQPQQLSRSVESPRDIPELSLQLARACTSAGAQALRNFVQANATFAQSLDRELCVQGILCIAIALIAGFFLFGFDAKIVHLNRWDFQFPPQPPNTGV